MVWWNDPQCMKACRNRRWDWLSGVPANPSNQAEQFAQQFAHFAHFGGRLAGL
jgi:hypothetical protein